MTETISPWAFTLLNLLLTSKARILLFGNVILIALMALSVTISKGLIYVARSLLWAQ